MSSAPDFVDFIHDQLQQVGPVVLRRMFGGHGYFIDGLMFAIAFDNVLYLKVDDVLKAELEALGLAPFSYSRGERLISLSYYQAPEEAMDDPEAMAYWGNRAFGAALYGRAK